MNSRPALNWPLENFQPGLSQRPFNELSALPITAKEAGCEFPSQMISPELCEPLFLVLVAIVTSGCLPPPPYHHHHPVL